MRRLLLVLTIACSTASRADPPKPTDPFAAPKLADRFLTACTKSCEQSQAKRAVAWQMIQAECRGGCEADWKLPLITRGKDAAKNTGERIRVRAVYHTKGERLVFEDGVEVPVRRPVALILLDGPIVAVGAFASDKLELHFAVAADPS